jgi:hypothetical protein
MARTPSALVSLPEPVLDPENPTPKQLRAARRRADIRIRAELGAALELAELDDVATLEQPGKAACGCRPAGCKDRSPLQRISICPSDQINRAAATGCRISRAAFKKAMR